MHSAVTIILEQDQLMLLWRRSRTSVHGEHSNQQLEKHSEAACDRFWGSPVRQAPA